MKKILLLFTLVVAITTSAMAQKQGNPERQMDPKKKEMILNAKIKHLQEKLMLSPQQTEQVIPIYKEYYQEIGALPFLKRNSRGEEFETTEQAYEFVMKNLERKKTILNIQEKCITKLKGVLNPQQLVNFLRVEHDIQKKIMNERFKRGDSRKMHKGAPEDADGKRN